jgi:hypothetical protein
MRDRIRTTIVNERAIPWQQTCRSRFDRVDHRMFHRRFHSWLDLDRATTCHCDGAVRMCVHLRSCSRESESWVCRALLLRTTPMISKRDVRRRAHAIDRSVRSDIQWPQQSVLTSDDWHRLYRQRKDNDVVQCR